MSYIEKLQIQADVALKRAKMATVLKSFLDTHFDNKRVVIKDTVYFISYEFDETEDNLNSDWYRFTVDLNYLFDKYGDIAIFAKPLLKCDFYLASCWGERKQIVIDELHSSSPHLIPKELFNQFLDKIDLIKGKILSLE